MSQSAVFDDNGDDDSMHDVTETDPSGRYEKLSQLLGHGAYKDVYKGFDTEEGMEVAWNQFRLDNLTARDANQILQEIRILQSLRHENIINMYGCWSVHQPDGREQVYFITELMTSGTLKNYVRKTKGLVKPKVLKNWCRQILSGLKYLHTRDPPIIHRDLKCENIFINGNNGQAKIGDLGLACVKTSARVTSVLGTPEFMAPELYDENYDEKVDIYSFGLVILEIVTKEYPYSECTNQAQIYKKVSSGVKPAALSKVADPDTLAFVELCLQFDPQNRPSASELLKNTFLVSLDASKPGSLIPRHVVGDYSASSTPDATPHFGPSQPSIPSSTTSARSISGALPASQSSSVSSSHDSLSNLPRSVALSEPATSLQLTKREFHSISDYPYPEQCQVALSSADQPGEYDVKMTYTNMNEPFEQQTVQTIRFTFSADHDTPSQVVREMVREGLIDTIWEQRATANLLHVVQQAKKQQQVDISKSQSTEKPAIFQTGPSQQFPASAAALKDEEKRKIESGYYSASSEMSFNNQHPFKNPSSTDSPNCNLEK